ncbi:60S ribosomal protein L28 [Thoreauomyces humboldtii]|nr:60S ribosomal protein L28 [Thoreauomyces humboldtii]
MSSDLIWLLVREQSSFLVKRNGVTLTREPGNLTQLNSLKFSGLAQKKAIDISFGEGGKGAKVSTKKANVPAHKQGKSLHTFTVKKGTRGGHKSITNVLATYRPDLQKHALARLSRVNESQVSKPRVVKPAKLRGARAKKAATA